MGRSVQIKACLHNAVSHQPSCPSSNHQSKVRGGKPFGDFKAPALEKSLDFSAFWGGGGGEWGWGFSLSVCCVFPHLHYKSFFNCWFRLFLFVFLRFFHCYLLPSSCLFCLTSREHESYQDLVLALLSSVVATLFINTRVNISIVTWVETQLQISVNIVGQQIVMKDKGRDVTKLSVSWRAVITGKTPEAHKWRLLQLRRNKTCVVIYSQQE